MDESFFYQLGKRDELAGILAENYKKQKLPELAKEYNERYGEHFSLKFHLA